MGRPDKPMGRTDKLIGHTDKPMGHPDKLMGRTDKLMGRQPVKVFLKDKSELVQTRQNRPRKIRKSQNLSGEVKKKRSVYFKLTVNNS
jgi:hypothetical protein